jgi:hypothetical protein
MSFDSERRFRLWDYNVSHKQMLLRSPKSPDAATNLDIVMWGVEYLDLATSLDGVRMASASREEVERAERALGRPLDSSQVFGLISGDRRFIVVAAGFKVLENDLDIFDSSLEYFAGTDPGRALGTVLAHSKGSGAGGLDTERGAGNGAGTHLPLPSPSSTTEAPPAAT